MAAGREAGAAEAEAAGRGSEVGRRELGTQSPRRPQPRRTSRMGDVAEAQPLSALTASTLEEGEAERG